MTTLIPKFEQVGSTTNRAINLKLQETISVKDFGAVGDGSTDDTVAIQAAITQVVNSGGGTVFFPAGTYNVSSTITVGNNVTLSGTGVKGSFIQVTSASINVLNITGSYTGVNNLGFKTTQTAQTAGSYIIAAGIYCYINNFYMDMPYTGITVTGVYTYISEGIIETVTSRNTAGNSAYIKINVPGEADCNISNIIMRINSFDTTTYPSYGINWVSGTVVHVSDCEILQADVGLNVAPGTGSTCLAGHFTDVYFDTILTHCAILNPSGTGTVSDIIFTACELGAKGGNGISLVQTGSANLVKVNINNCVFVQYDAPNGSGVFITSAYAGPMYVIVSNCIIGGLTTNGGFQNGIDVTGASNYTLIGNDVSYNSINGIVTTGASDYYIITSNRTFNNTTNDIADNATGTNKVVANNLS